MFLRESILIILFFVIVAQSCGCTEKHQGMCEHGECYSTENCGTACNCTEGWIGVFCGVECKRDCNGGTCYFEDDEEHCSCPIGFTRISNCTERQTIPVSSAGVKNREPDNRLLIPIVVIPVSMLCLFVVILYLLWRRRVLFAMRIVHYFQWQNNDGDKEFDAFISFRSSETDEDWVLHTLFPMLEENMGYRVCIHHRDFPCGELISNNIIDAVENSRRTILVISPDYVTSEWTRMEYQVAQQEMLKLRHRIIPIMFRDVEDANNIDKSLKFLLRTVTYIKWPGDMDTKELNRFWEQLRLTMPKKTSQNKIQDESECEIEMKVANPKTRTGPSNSSPPNLQYSSIPKNNNKIPIKIT